MFAVLLVWIGHWLHSDGIGAAQRMELCGANAMQISWLCYLFFIFICVSLVERNKLRFVVEFPVKRIKLNLNYLRLMSNCPISNYSQHDNRIYHVLRAKEILFVYAVCMGVVFVFDICRFYTRFNQITVTGITARHWCADLLFEK